MDAVLNPPALRAELEIDGKRLEVHSSGIGITNNLFGEGHLPFTDDPDGGRLGVYVSKARTRRETVLFSLNLALGRWERNEHLDIREGRKVVLTIKSVRGTRRCVIDGELRALDRRTELTVLPGRLRVLAPASGEPD